MMLKKMLPITVLMSTYSGNKAAYLFECLNSLKSQTMPPSEILLVVDGEVSADQISVIENFTYAGEFSVYYFEKNHGLAYCMNFAIKHAKKPVLARMDADDICHKERFEKQYELVKDEDNLVCCSWHAEFSDTIDNIVYFKKTHMNFFKIKKKIKLRNVISHPTIMLHKRIFENFGGYDEEIGLLEDYELHLRLIKKGVKYKAIQEALVYVRTDNFQYSRRGGFRYFKNEIFFRLKCLKNKYINIFDFIFSVFLYAIFRLSPNFIRKSLYFLVRDKN